MSDLFINPSNPLQQLNELQKQAQTKNVDAGEGKFGNVLTQAMQEIDHLQNESHQEIGKVLGGDITDVHSAMIAMQKADLSFQMMMQIRNKLVEAYHEIMRMQV